MGCLFLFKGASLWFHTSTTGGECPEFLYRQWPVFHVNKGVFDKTPMAFDKEKGFKRVEINRTMPGMTSNPHTETEVKGMTGPTKDISIKRKHRSPQEV